MSNWISDENGKWHPAKESVGLKNISDKPIIIEVKSDDGKIFKKTVPPGGDYVYEGPDRAAMFQWWEENGKPSAEQMKEMVNGVTFGEDFRQNTEFMEQYAKFRQMFGFENVDAYLKYLGFDTVKAHKRFEEKASIVATHEAPAKMKEVQRIGGGTDLANPGKNLKHGGFGDIPPLV